MKLSLLALLTALLFTSCAGSRIANTSVSTGATNPKAIYIRPFTVAYARTNSSPIRKSLLPAQFASILEEELDKIAPAMVLKPDEYPPLGWLVEGQFEVVQSNLPQTRMGPTKGFATGPSRVKIHVRITDLGKDPVKEVTKEEVKADATGASVTESKVATYEGRVVYEFDVIASSGFNGPYGSIYAPGMGDSVSFDLRNAAERIYLALTPDPFRYGTRGALIQTF